MKKLSSLVLAAVLAFSALPVQAAENKFVSPADITAETAVLMDADTGQVLFTKNMDQRVYPASTTKIMTGLLVCENTSPQDVVTVTETALDIAEWNSANIALSTGEQLTVDSALYALMLPSANDAANALAEQVAGTQEQFIALMNQRAKELGASSTHFANAHGLHDQSHYTTARDMAIITSYAAQNSMFMHYFGTGTHTIPATNLQPQERPFTNYQYMTVKESQFYDPAVLGGKVGYTREAKHTMSTVAQRNGRTLVCVVMGTPGRYDKFDDTEKLFEYGFTQFRSVTVPRSHLVDMAVPVSNDAGATGQVHITGEADFTALLRNDISEDSIQIKHDIADSYTTDSPMPTSADITIPNLDPSLPSLLGSYPLQTYVSASTPATASSLQSQNKTQTALPVPAPVIAAGGILFFLGASFILRQRALEKRRKRRMERLQRRMRQSGRYQDRNAS